jgi:glc operon protein GlcG
VSDQHPDAEGDRATVPRFDISRHAARRLVDDVIAGATAAEAAVTVAVVDNGGVLVAFERMDGAPRFSAQIAIAKAQTAATFGNATSSMEATFRDRPVFANSFAQLGGWYFGRGGFPIVVGDDLVGGIGVSGERAEREEELASQAARSLAPSE